MWAGATMTMEPRRPDAMCPTLERLIQWRDGRLESAEERKRIDDHVRDCPLCLETMRFASRIESAVGSSAAPRSAAGIGAPSTTHPDEFDLALFAESRIDEAGRERLAAHFADCEPCRMAIVEYTRDLRDLAPGAAPHRYAARGIALSEGRETEGELRGLPSPSLASRILGFFRPSPGQPSSWLGAAGALAAFVLAVTLLPRAVMGPGEGGIRGDDDPSGLAIVSPARDTIDRDALAAGRIVLEWTPAAGATSYRAVVASSDGALHLETRIPGTRWTPQVAASALAGHKQILFWVEGYAGDRRIASVTRTIHLE
jgi:hypothetical protein